METSSQVNGEVTMASKNLNLTIVPNLPGENSTCDKSEIQQKLKALVKLLAKNAAQQLALERSLS